LQGTLRGKTPCERIRSSTEDREHAIAGGLEDASAGRLDRARSSESCRASGNCIASGYWSHSDVLPSMSVNRKVTVPVGNNEFTGCLADMNVSERDGTGTTHFADRHRFTKETAFALYSAHGR
jgi:hypothetical protein